MNTGYCAREVGRFAPDCQGSVHGLYVTCQSSAFSAVWEKMENSYLISPVVKYYQGLNSADQRVHLNLTIKATTGGPQRSSLPSITRLFHCHRQLCLTITNPWSYIVMIPSVCWYVVDEPVVCYSSNSFHMLECPGSNIFNATTGGRKPGHRPPSGGLKSKVDWPCLHKPLDYRRTDKVHGLVMVNLGF